MENRKALLVIDMQKGSFTSETPRFDTNGVVKRINELAEMFRELNYPVFIYSTMELELENSKKIIRIGKFR